MTAGLLERLTRHADAHGPVRVGLLGAGKFGSMFLNQARLLQGVHVVAVCDLSLPAARAALERTGWPAARFAATSIGDALRDGSTYLTSSADEVLEIEPLDVVVEATGNPLAGARHAMRAIDRKCHVIMVTAEADALVGPALARRARSADVVYSLAYGDQPALICELVEWARACGFDVIAAGKGTKYLPDYPYSTPETVWEHYGIDSAYAAETGLNPRMFNSFVDGTKSAIEMACVANATGLSPQPQGLRFPPCGAHQLAQVLRPESIGGTLSHAGTVEVVSSLERDGTAVAQDLRWGVYVTFAAPNEFARSCFAEYGLATDETGWVAAMYRPYHLIGLEVSISVLGAVLRGEATGSPRGFHADVVARAKRPLQAGESLDGEGGATVYGSLLGATDSLSIGALPIGLAADAVLKGALPRDAIVRLSDVTIPHAGVAGALRAEMEVPASTDTYSLALT